MTIIFVCFQIYSTEHTGGSSSYGSNPSTPVSSPPPNMSGKNFLLFRNRSRSFCRQLRRPTWYKRLRFVEILHKRMHGEISCQTASENTKQREVYKKKMKISMQTCRIIQVSPPKQHLLYARVLKNPSGLKAKMPNSHITLSNRLV